MSFLSPNQQCQSTEETQSTEPNQCPGLILSSSTTGLVTEGALFPSSQPCFLCASVSWFSASQLLCFVTWLVYLSAAYEGLFTGDGLMFMKIQKGYV